MNPRSPRPRTLAAVAAAIAAASIHAQNVVTYTATEDPYWFANTNGYYFHWGPIGALPGVNDLAYWNTAGYSIYNGNSTLWGYRQDHVDSKLSIQGGAYMGILHTFELLHGTTELSSGTIALGDNAVITNQDRFVFYGGTTGQVRGNGTGLFDNYGSVSVVAGPAGSGGHNFSGIVFRNRGFVNVGSDGYLEFFNSTYDDALGGSLTSALGSRLRLTDNAAFTVRNASLLGVTELNPGNGQSATLNLQGGIVNDGRFYDLANLNLSGAATGNFRFAGRNTLSGVVSATSRVTLGSVSSTSSLGLTSSILNAGAFLFDGTGGNAIYSSGPRKTFENRGSVGTATGASGGNYFGSVDFLNAGVLSLSPNSYLEFYNSTYDDAVGGSLVSASGSRLRLTDNANLTLRDANLLGLTDVSPNNGQYATLNLLGGYVADGRFYDLANLNLAEAATGDFRFAGRNAFSGVLNAASRVTLGSASSSSSLGLTGSIVNRGVFSLEGTGGNVIYSSGPRKTFDNRNSVSTATGASGSNSFNFVDFQNAGSVNVGSNSYLEFYNSTYDDATGGTLGSAAGSKLRLTDNANLTLRNANLAGVTELSPNNGQYATLSLLGGSVADGRLYDLANLNLADGATGSFRFVGRNAFSGIVNASSKITLGNASTPSSLGLTSSVANFGNFGLEGTGGNTIYSSGSRKTFDNRGSVVTATGATGGNSFNFVDFKNANSLNIGSNSYLEFYNSTYDDAMGGSLASAPNSRLRLTDNASFTIRSANVQGLLEVSPNNGQSGTLSLLGGFISDARLNDLANLTIAEASTGNFKFAGRNTFSGTISIPSTVRLGDASSTSSLGLVGPTANKGLFEFDGTGANRVYSSGTRKRFDNSGTMVVDGAARGDNGFDNVDLRNTGLLDVRGQGAFRMANSEMTNSGTLRLAPDASFSLSSTTFAQTGGTFDGAFIMDSGTARFLGGTLTGGATLIGGTLELGAPATGTFALSGASGLKGSIGANTTVNASARSGASSTLDTGDLLTNTGTLNLRGAGSTTLRGSLVNNGLLHVYGDGGAATLSTGALTGNGLVLIDAGATLTATSETLGLANLSVASTGALNVNSSTATIQAGTISGALSASSSAVTVQGGSFSGQGVFSNSTVKIAPVVTGNLVVQRATTLNAGLGSGADLDVHSQLGSYNTVLTTDGTLVNGGTVHLTGGGDTRISGKLRNEGTLIVENDGGTNHLDMVLDSTGLVRVDADATLGVAGAIHKNEGTLSVGIGATLTVTGTAFVNEESGIIKGKGTFDVSGVNFINYGTYAPGQSPGWMTHKGDFAQGPNGLLQLEIGGEPGSYLADRLDVIGNASLGGYLDMRLWQGYAPTVGSLYTVMTYTGSRAGSFLGAIGDGQWGIEYGSGTVNVRYQAVPEPASFAALGLGTLVLLRRRRVV